MAEMQTPLTAQQVSAYVDFGFTLPGKGLSEWSEEFRALGGTACSVTPGATVGTLEVSAAGSPEAVALVERTVKALVWADHQRAYDTGVAQLPMGTGPR